MKKLFFVTILAVLMQSAGWTANTNNGEQTGGPDRQSQVAFSQAADLHQHSRAGSTQAADLNQYSRAGSTQAADLNQYSRAGSTQAADLHQRSRVTASEPAAPQSMMLENRSSFGFDETVAKIEVASKDHGWSIPAVFNLQQSMKKAGHEVLPVKVINLCNPAHAVKLLSEDPYRIVSNMMPCRLSVYMKKDGYCYISRMNIPSIAGNMSGTTARVMEEAYRDIEKILSGILQD